jgi:hypothetical protein
MSTCPYYKQCEDVFDCPFTSHFRNKSLAPDGPDGNYFVEFKNNTRVDAQYLYLTFSWTAITNE